MNKECIHCGNFFQSWRMWFAHAPYCLKEKMVTEELVEKAAQERVNQLEVLALAFFKETGNRPSEWELVEVREHSSIRWFFRKKEPPKIHICSICKKEGW